MPVAALMVPRRSFVMPAVPMLRHSRSDVPVANAVRMGRASLVACLAALAAGCATTAELGRTERLPEGTLPPSKEVGPPVNIQPAPLAREQYRVVPRHPAIYGPGWYGSRCFDPLLCSRSGFGLHYRVF
jgi:hypothetical protein